MNKVGVFVRKYLSENHINLILVIYLIFLFLLQASVHLKDYTRPFRENFLYTLYNHSQWVDPQSKYGIGDDGLYQVAGHQLISKHNFFEVNPEVPPLGKYYYGLSIKILGNAEYGALLLFLGSIALFYSVSKQFIKSTFLFIFAMFFFVSDPLLFYQSYVSMLDLPQLIFLLAHILSMTWVLNSNSKYQNFAVLLAGISLGLFVSVKIGFFAAIILIADAIVFFRLKKFRELIALPVLAGIIYVFVYGMYFLQGNSLADFIRAQKWILNFYLSSRVESTTGTVFSTLLFGKIIGWNHNAAWTTVSDWTIMWSIYIITFFIAVLKFFKNRDFIKINSQTYIVLLTIGLLTRNIFIPFFTRYLVLKIPLLIIILFSFLEQLKVKKSIILGGFFIFFSIHYVMFWN